MAEWKREAARLRLEEGISWADLAERYSGEYPGMNSTQVRRRLYEIVRKAKKTGQDLTKDPLPDGSGCVTYLDSGHLETSEGDPLLDICSCKGLTPELLLEKHGLSINDWAVVNYINNYWHSQAKGGKRLVMYQSKLVAKPVVTGVTFEDILKFFEETQFNIRKPLVIPQQYDPTGETLEIDVADLHAGLYSWMAETGANYDVHIAKKFFMRGVADVLSRCAGRKFKKIVLALLGDLLHTDNEQQSTTKGTLQQVDGRMPYVFTETLEMLVETIDLFTEVAPVDVLYTRGNHDYLTGWTLIKSLEQAYKDAPYVTVDVSPDTQKHRLFGRTLVGFVHGNMPDKNDSGWLQVIAREMAVPIAYMEVHRGHDHNEKTKEIKQTQTNQGVVVRTMPSICNASTYEHNEGYAGSTQAVICFVWDDVRGLREQWYCNM